MERLSLQFLGVVLLGASVFLGCGGGSSGTGSDTAGSQIIDEDCEPAAEEDLHRLGIPSTEVYADASGRFVLAADFFAESESEECLLFFKQRGAVVAQGYSRRFLADCSLEAVREAFADTTIVDCNE